MRKRLLLLLPLLAGAVGTAGPPAPPQQAQGPEGEIRPGTMAEVGGSVLRADAGNRMLRIRADDGDTMAFFVEAKTPVYPRRGTPVTFHAVRSGQRIRVRYAVDTMRVESITILNRH